MWDITDNNLKYKSEIEIFGQDIQIVLFGLFLKALKHVR